MPRGRIHPRIFDLLVVLLIVGIILSIVGGVDLASTETQTRQQGHTLSHASSILLLVAFVIMSGTAIVTFLNIQNTIKGDRILLYAIAATWPFLLVRVVYLMLGSFGAGNGLFNTVTGSVIVLAFMAIFEEFVIVISYLMAGLLAPKLNRSHLQPGKRTNMDTEAQDDGSKDHESKRLSHDEWKSTNVEFKVPTLTPVDQYPPQQSGYTH